MRESYSADPNRRPESAPWGLAPFDGREVEAAITAALEDPDWQTRQAAEDLVVRSTD